jgi:hypothetical protein
MVAVVGTVITTVPAVVLTVIAVPPAAVTCPAVKATGGPDGDGRGEKAGRGEPPAPGP